MEIDENHLSTEMYKNVKDIIAGAFKYEKGNYDRAKYIVERLTEIYGNTSYNFCCIIGDRYSYDSFFYYSKDIFLRCFFGNKQIILWSGR